MMIWRVLLFYIPLTMPIRLPSRHVFLIKTLQNGTHFLIRFFVFLDGAFIPFYFEWQQAGIFSSVHFRVLLEDRDFH